MQQFEQFIQIKADPSTVERTITDRALMRQWLNPALLCEPVGEWSTHVGSESQFIVAIPGVGRSIRPTLNNRVIERSSSSVVWSFTGFFEGRDRWTWEACADGTRLVNCFEFEIPNPLIRFGFNTFAARWTQGDMQAQLRRISAIAQNLETELS